MKKDNTALLAWWQVLDMELEKGAMRPGHVSVKAALRGKTASIIAETS